MHQFKASSGRRLAQTIIAAHRAVDTALLQVSRLATNMLEVGAEAQIPAADGQKALEAVADGFSTIVAGRDRIVRAHRQMVTMKDQSNLNITDMGCVPGPLAASHLAVAS